MGGAVQIDELLFITAKEIVFPLFTPDDDLVVRGRANMSAHLEQHDVVHFVFALATRLPQVDQLA